MPNFRAIIEGQNFLFMLDDEVQYLDFHRTVCLEAECIKSAGELALESVIEELTLQDLLIDMNRNKSSINLGHIECVDVQETICLEQDFIWYFPDDAVFDYTLKQH